MATFADNSVANFFFTRHGDQNGRSLERCKGKANFALEDILSRNGSDNRIPGSRNERAHLTDLVFTGSGVSACEV